MAFDPATLAVNFLMAKQSQEAERKAALLKQQQELMASTQASFNSAVPNSQGASQANNFLQRPLFGVGGQ
jgi:hypothetical protein